MKEKDKDYKNLKEIVDLCKQELSIDRNEPINATLDIVDLHSLDNLLDMYMLYKHNTMEQYNSKWGKRYLKEVRAEVPGIYLPDSQDIFRKYFEQKQEIAELKRRLAKNKYTITDEDLLIKDLQKQVRVKDEYLDLIWGVGFDYDGYDTDVDGLKSVIDTMTDYSVKGLNNDTTSVIYGIEPPYRNILREIVDKEEIKAEEEE